ncbi:MAG: TCR/Tet family MFS transporter, partial [Pseudomonadota bacterium]
MLRPAPKPDGRAMLFVFITVLLSLMGLGIIIPVMPDLIIELTGESRSRAAELNGLLLFSYAAMQFVMSPVLGALSDRFGRRPVILISVFAYAVDFLLMAIAPTFAWLFAGRLLSGATAATFSTANAFIADITPPEQRAARFGLLGAAFGLGFIIGPVMGGFVGDQFGPRAPFILASAITFANFLFGYLVFPETLTPERQRKFSLWRANPLGGLITVGSRPLVLGILIAFFLTQLAQQSLPSIWAFFTGEKFGWNGREIGLSLAYVGITAAIVQGGLTRVLIPRLGNTRAVLIGMAAMTTSLIGYAFFTPSGPWVYLWITVGALGGFMMPGIQAKVSEATPANAQGELQGAIASLMSITMAISPLMMSWVFG